jgi:hypothetical protein
MAQKYNLVAAGSNDWFIDDQGRACAYNAVDLHFSKGVRSIIRPRLVDSSSPECQNIVTSSATKGGASRKAKTVSALPQGVAGPDALVVEAIPVPGRQNIPCSAAECGF